ncbi:MAG: response regulator, partial [Planctomycetota bacterium]
IEALPTQELTLSTDRTVQRERGPKAPPSAVEREALDRFPEGEPRILIVDDSYTVRKLLANALASIRAQSKEASDGQEALRMLRRAHDEALPFDLVLLNLHMPLLDGAQALIRVRSDPNLWSVPVVIMSTESERARIFQCTRYGIHGYLVKPFNIAKVLKTVRQALTTAPMDPSQEFQEEEFLTYEEILKVRDALMAAGQRAAQEGLSTVQKPEDHPVIKGFMEFLETRGSRPDPGQSSF